ncbi:hypothetical protein M0R04_13150 [Candidatus Dojkabacteria bacterium]|jgi:hypothetical protein|nr:hypothetical protein [Candidatus Dojkabacteria bacterium]
MINPRFYKLLDKIKDIHDKKSHDYATEDPFSNFRQCEKFGIPAWKGPMVRMSDKWSRLVNLSTKEAKVEDERFEDTLMDLSIYALICILLREDAK